jgi:hypothetical protein
MTELFGQHQGAFLQMVATCTIVQGLDLVKQPRINRIFMLMACVFSCRAVLSQAWQLQAKSNE